MVAASSVPVSGFLVVAVLTAVYVLPAVVAVARGWPGLARPALVWGWTGVGWLVVLAVALSRPSRRRAAVWEERSWW